MLEKSIFRELSKDIPHQKCLKHALDNIIKIVGLLQKKKRLQKLTRQSTLCREGYKIAEDEYLEAQRIYLVSKEMFYCKRLKDSLKLLKELSLYYNKYPTLREFFTCNLDKLLTHQEKPEISQNNNISENVNRQLMRRLKTIESFQSFVTAENYLNLYKNYLRFKPYTDCRGKNKQQKGKSPLEVYGVVLKTKDWLKNSLDLY